MSSRPLNGYRPEVVEQTNTRARLHAAAYVTDVLGTEDRTMTRGRHKPHPLRSAASWYDEIHEKVRKRDSGGSKSFSL